MTDDAARYLSLAAEISGMDADNPRYDGLIEEMDEIWWRISEDEQDEIEARLAMPENEAESIR